jgi:putative DNA primase/helicase
VLTTLQDIVREHGGSLYAGGRRAVIPGPGHSRADRSLSLTLTDEGRVVWCSFADDPAAEVFRYLGIERQDGHEATSHERAAHRRRREAEQRKRIADDRAFCVAVWEGTEPLEGTAAEAYLWSRGLICDDCPDLRFHPAAPRGKPRAEGDKPLPPPHPALVALIRSGNGAPLGLHVTFVRPDGTGKAFGERSRLMFGQISGGSVHLSPAGRELAVGEGIETCIAYRARTGKPTWAALSTSLYASFRFPAFVRRLTIAADGDAQGLTAAQGLAGRMCKLADVIIDPAPDGSDWADVWSADHG